MTDLPTSPGARPADDASARDLARLHALMAMRLRVIRPSLDWLTEAVLTVAPHPDAPSGAPPDVP